MKHSRFSRGQSMTIVHGILSMVAIMVILQLWLFTATVGAYLGGDTTILLAAALASLVCLLLNAGLLRYLFKLDRQPAYSAEKADSPLTRDQAPAFSAEKINYPDRTISTAWPK